MRYQLTCSCNTTGTTKARMIEQSAGLLFKKFIKCQCGCRVVGLDVVIDCIAVIYRLWRPE